MAEGLTSIKPWAQSKTAPLFAWTNRAPSGAKKGMKMAKKGGGKKGTKKGKK